MDDRDALLRRTAELADGFLERLPDRPVSQAVNLADLRATLGGPLPASGEDPLEVIEALARRAEPGLVGSAGPRYFGFVVGGGVPAALAADWLASAWDQNAVMFALSPAAAVAEEVAAACLLDVFGLPEGCGVGFVTGATMRRADGVTILNDVVLNPVLVRFEPPGGGDADAFTRAVIAAVQADGTCWLGGTTWHGMAGMRISVSNWSTTKRDADLSFEAILRCAREVGATGSSVGG
jgi:glutamate/tyrosine decarboxylase-like PLP-dependent enzyme